MQPGELRLVLAVVIGKPEQLLTLMVVVDARFHVPVQICEIGLRDFAVLMRAYHGLVQLFQFAHQQVRIEQRAA